MHETRLRVTAEDGRWLAQKRVSVALGALPLFVVLGSGALVVSLDLALVAVLSAFFAYACVSIARRQREVARAAADFEVLVRDDVLDLPGQAPRKIFKAINRPDYLRLITTEARVVGLWLDNRRDPTASFDVPGSPQRREALCASLRAAGVPVANEGAAQRVLVLGGALALALAGLTTWRVLLGLTVTAALLSPMFWALIAALVIAVGLSWRQRG
jgi:hypothetical protein